MQIHPVIQKAWDEKLKQHNKSTLKPRRNRRYIPRPKRTGTELVNYIRTRFITSSRELMKLRGATDPTIADYISTFGKWSIAVQAAHGPQPPSVKFPSTKDYIIDAAVLMEIRTRDEYLAKRQLHPDVLPSINQVRKFFPNWKAVRMEIEKRSLNISLGRYLALSNQLRRIPTTKDLDKWQVDITALRRFFGGKHQLDKFLSAS